MTDRLITYLRAAQRMQDRAHASRRCGDYRRALLQLDTSSRLQRWSTERPDFAAGTPRTKNDTLGHGTGTLEVAA